LRQRLIPGFRYVHEPLLSGDDSIPFLGNEELVRALTQRLTHSRGGAFLITGFRGVGKTTVIARALHEIAKNQRPDIAILPISLSVARPMTTNQLLFAIVRRVFESLDDQEIFQRLSADVQRALLLAYMRTSLYFKETRANSLEESRSFGVGGSIPATAGPAAAILNAMAPKLSLANKRTRSLATEASFLAYSDTDVEHDVLRIVGLLDLADQKESIFRRILSVLGLRSRTTKPSKIHPIIVLDELDKLTAGEQGPEKVEQLLSDLKNILTMPGVHFLFVGGPDLHDKVLRDSNRGNSVYESVFGWQLYVPCIWDAADRFIDALVSENQAKSDELEDFLRYLKFKARGIPRRLLQEFNGFVTWDTSIPLLATRSQDGSRVRFYSDLETILSEFFGTTGEERLLPVPIDDDRWRLGAYYVVEWILRSEGKPFTADEIAGAESSAEIDPLLRVSSRIVNRLLQHLAENKIIEQVRTPGPRLTVYEDVSRLQTPLFRLSSDVARKLFGFALENEQERADLNISGVIPRASSTAIIESWPDAPSESRVTGAPVPPPPVPSLISSANLLRPMLALKQGRYEVEETISRGGMSTVYRGSDKLINRKVAIKVLDTSLASDKTMRSRFMREGQIASQLAHPNIVQTYDAVEEKDGPLALVMEFLEGPTLREALQDRRFSASHAVHICVKLCEALDYLNSHGVFRVDLKPENVILVRGVFPKVVDLGLAKRLGPDPRSSFATQEGYLVGTPAYMAPEQIVGSQVDIRADLYSLGLVLFELLSGESARKASDLSEIFSEIVAELDLSDLRVSEELRKVIAQSTAREPNDRFSTPSEMYTALIACPEYQSRMEGSTTS